ncbi:MAG: hypothetical protein LBL45_09525 [Treponema sp.]|nr:hypothetical protein [Treponema sp.]
MVFDQNHHLPPYLEGDVVDPLHEQRAFKRVDLYRDGRVKFHALKGAVQVPQGVRVAEKKGEHAVFVLFVYIHVYL